MTGFTSPNHTDCPNDLFDVHMMDMGECELKVTLAIIRKTLGYHKKSDPISLTQLQKLTGLSRQGALDGVNAAIARGLVEIVGTGKRGVQIFGLVINSDQSTNETSEAVDQSKIQTTTGQQNRPVTGLKFRHTKENKTKETSQKKKEKKENAPDGATPPKPTPKVFYPPKTKDWTWKHVEQYACDNPTIELLAGFDDGRKLKNLVTKNVAHDVIELFQELTRNNVSAERWQHLHTAALKIKHQASIFKRMLWALPDWLKSGPPITVVTVDPDMPRPDKPVWYPGMKAPEGVKAS